MWKVDISKIDCRKIRICPRDLFYFCKIVNAISGDVERSTANQRLINRTQKTLASNSTLPMPPFWPRIGEQEVKCFHRCGRQQIADSIGNFHSQQAHVVDLGGSARDGADPTDQTLDSKKIFLRHALGQRAKKRAVAAAQIDMERRIASKEFFEIKPFEQRLWFDDRRTPKPFGAVSRLNLARRHAEERTKQWPSQQA